MYSEADVKKKYRFDDTTWKKLGEDDALIEAIELERTRRIRNGAAKREKAQQLVVKAPDILDSIMSDTSVSPKHRIDSAKVLDAFTGNAAETTMASERFVITINLGEDYKLKFDKSITPVANDKDVEIIDNNTGVLAAVAASKREDNGGGEPI